MASAAVVGSRTVLVADATAFVRERFEAALKSGGHRTITARSGSELLSHLRPGSAPVDLLVLDLRLPQAHGLQLVRTIRGIDARRPAIVVFSGTIASSDEVRELATLGVSGYVNEYIAAQHILRSLTPHLTAGQQNRRSGPRVVLGIPVSYRHENRIASALTLNVGRGGVSLRTTNPLDVGTKVRARFRLPGRPEAEVDARVAWVDRRIGMGLQFTRVDAATQAMIDEFIQAHFFSNRKA